MALSHHMFSRERDDRSYIIVNEEISESESPFFLSDRAFPFDRFPHQFSMRKGFQFPRFPDRH